MKITVTEFRKNLKKYLDLLEKGEIVEVRGIALQAKYVLKKFGDGGEIETVLQKNPYACKKCGNIKSAGKCINNDCK